MKACVLEANQLINVKDVVIDEPKDDEVTVEVVSCGICGSDIPRYFSNGAHFYPLVLGHEFYGVVKKTGNNVKEVRVGDDVVGVPLIPCFECEDCKNGNYSLCKHYKFIGSSVNGAYCEQLNLPKTNVFKINHKIANQYCALFEPSCVALHALKMFDGYEDSTVAVIGGGTIGSLVAKWAMLYGAKTVVLFEINLNNTETYKELGIENLRTSSDEDIEGAIVEFTNSNGFDFVFDAAGANVTILKSLQLAKNKAKICFVGTPTSEVRFTMKEWETINRKELLLTGSWMSYSAPFPGSEWVETEKALLDSSLEFKKEYFAGIFKMEDVTKAFNFIKNGKDGKVGRVLLTTNKLKE